METRLLQLELNMDSSKRDIEELKEIVQALSTMINDIQTKVNYLVDLKGKSI